MKKLLVLLLPILAFAGCSRPSLVGKWKTDVPYNMQKVPMSIDIKDGGKWTARLITNEVRTPIMVLPPVTADTSGTWKLDGEALMFAADVTNISGAPEPMKALMPLVEKAITTELNNYAQSKVKFNEDKTVLITNAKGDNLTLTRDSG